MTRFRKHPAHYPQRYFCKALELETTGKLRSFPIALIGTYLCLVVFSPPSEFLLCWLLGSLNEHPRLGANDHRLEFLLLSYSLC